MNRYYGGNMGRFLSPDQGPPLLANPNSWNRYAYSWNDPVNYNDQDGLTPGTVIVNDSLAPWIGEEGASSFGGSFLRFLLQGNPRVPGGGTVIGLSRLEMHRSLNDTLKFQGAAAIENLSSRCVNALAGKGISQGALLDAAVQIEYYGAPFEGNSSTASISGYVDDNGRSMSLRRYVGGDRAAVLLDHKRQITPNVVLGASFFTDARGYSSLRASQDVTLIHETLHVQTKLGDVDLADLLGFGKLEHTAASAKISSWLRNDCAPVNSERSSP